MPRWVTVMRAEELPPDQPVTVRVNEREIALAALRAGRRSARPRQPLPAPRRTARGRHDQRRGHPAARLRLRPAYRHLALRADGARARLPRPDPRGRGADRRGRGARAARGPRRRLPRSLGAPPRRAGALLRVSAGAAQRPAGERDAHAQAVDAALGRHPAAARPARAPAAAAERAALAAHGARATRRAAARPRRAVLRLPHVVRRALGEREDGAGARLRAARHGDRIGRGRDAGRGARARREGDLRDGERLLRLVDATGRARRRRRDQDRPVGEGRLRRPAASRQGHRPHRHGARPAGRRGGALARALHGHPLPRRTAHAHRGDPRSPRRRAGGDQIRRRPGRGGSRRGDRGLRRLRDDRRPGRRHGRRAPRC